MARSVSTVHRATYKCDWCDATAVIELDPIKYDRSQYISGSDEAPDGWVMASSGRPNKSDSIPDLYFDTEDHFRLWKEQATREFAAKVVIL